MWRGFVIVAGLLSPGWTMAQTVDFIDPTGGFTQVVTVTDRGVKTVFVSGQVGRGETYEAQVESVFASVARRLAQGGATVRDVVKMRAFVTDMSPERYQELARVRRETFPEGAWPASTVAGVQALARAEYQVEVEALAVVAEEGAELAIERFAPSNGFSGAVAVTAHGVKTIYVAGQVGEGGGLPIQTASVWERIGQRLAEAGATYADLVKTTTYIVDLDPATYFESYRDGVPPIVSNLDDRAASTLVGVPALASERFVVEVDAVAVVEAGQPLTREFIEPAGSYTQVVTTRGGSARTVYVSGQVGTPGDPLEDQADQAYANLRRRLQAAGASPADLLKVTVYVPGYQEDDRPALAAAREKHGFTEGGAPASTLLGIQSLFAAEAAVEVEGIAVVDR